MPAANATPTLAPEATEQELKDFSYIVSHDLATEFRHVEVFSKQLLEIPDIRDNPSWRSYASIILAASDRCRGMLDELRTYSRAQQSSLQVVECDAHLVVGRALLQLGTAIRSANAKLTIRVRERIAVDAEWMMIAVREVLRNAVRFARPGAPPQIEIRDARDEGAWRLQITDHGIGLDPAFWEKAFRMFWKLNTSGDGLGSGLAISRRIVRRHGGDIRFLPTQEGACVEITLPSNRTESKA